jgi:putative Holliday junction resolvase
MHRDMNNLLKPKGPVLAVDPGEKRIGVAISDPGGVLARGLTVLEASGGRSVEGELTRLVEGNRVTRIVVGLPLNLNGSEGEQSRKARRLGDRLRLLTGVEVEMWDERLTSLQADKILLEADLSRRKRRRKIDLLSARIILQSYLDCR